MKQIQVKKNKNRCFNRILSHKNVNTTRQWEMDMARTAMILCLPLIHCIIESPMYMFVMGVGMVYTKNSNPRQHDYHRSQRGHQESIQDYRI